MSKLVLVRHGQSWWNLQNRFTGWVDIPLSKKGIAEAKRAGTLLNNTKFDVAYSGYLIRAIETLVILCDYLKSDLTPIIQHRGGRGKAWSHHVNFGNGDLPVHIDEALNERYYGDLQGLNKKELMKKVGKEQVHIWRRSYSIRPPGGESLKDTVKRTLPFFKKKVLPKLKDGKNILIVASGNSLRSIVMHLENISEKDIPHLEIATGVPIVYNVNNKGEIKSKKILK